MECATTNRSKEIRRCRVRSTTKSNKNTITNRVMLTNRPNRERDIGTTTDS